MFLLQLADSNIVITQQEEIVARTTALNIIANRKAELENCLSKHKEDLDEHASHTTEEMVKLSDQLKNGVKEDAIQFKKELAEQAKMVKEELVKLTDLANAHSKINDSIVCRMQALEREYYSAKQVCRMYTIFSYLPYIAFAEKTNI